MDRESESDDAGPGNVALARASAAWRPEFPKLAAPLLAWVAVIPLSVLLFAVAIGVLALR
jgi:hypothetical protein